MVCYPFLLSPAPRLPGVSPTSFRASPPPTSFRVCVHLYLLPPLCTKLRTSERADPSRSIRLEGVSNSRTSPPSRIRMRSESSSVFSRWATVCASRRCINGEGSWSTRACQQDGAAPRSWGMAHDLVYRRNWQGRRACMEHSGHMPSASSRNHAQDGA